MSKPYPHLVAGAERRPLLSERDTWRAAVTEVANEKDHGQTVATCDHKHRTASAAERCAPAIARWWVRQRGANR